MENADRIRRPSSGEVKTRTHFGQIVFFVDFLQERFTSETFRVVALAEQPGKYLTIKKRETTRTVFCSGVNSDEIWML